MQATAAALNSRILDRAIELAGWTPVHARNVQRSYLALLDRCARAGEPLPPPDRDIDLLWHVHMLHPADYARFCAERYSTIIDHVLPVMPIAADGDDASLLMATAGCNQKCEAAT